MNISLESEFEEILLNKGDVLFKENTSLDYLYLLKKGCVCCLKTQHDRIIPIYTHFETGIVGEEVLLSGGEFYSYSAVILSDNTKVVKIPKNQIDSFLYGVSEWIPKLLANISHKLSQTSSLISEHQIIDDRLQSGHEISDDDLILMRNALN